MSAAISYRDGRQPAHNNPDERSGYVKPQSQLCSGGLSVGTSQQCSRFQHDLIALMPHLRAFSRILCNRRDFAEDLAQEALMKAWRARGSFQAGTNLKAWLFTILRNAFYSQGRRAWRQSHWDADAAERIEAPANEQVWALELSDTTRAMRDLPDSQREALILVGAGGFSYEEAASICNTPVGTMKSRVARGRAALSTALDSDRPLPPLSSKPVIDAVEDILVQLSVLTQSANIPAIRLPD